MIKQICILTKSYKHGGFCVAGIDINTGQWIRLVNSDDPNTDEIRKEQMFLNGKPIECLDIIEYDFIKNIPNSCQTENWLLNATFKPRFIKSITIEGLINLIKIEKEDYFIFNNSNLLSIDEISKVNRSLFVFHVQNLKIEATTYESYGEIRFRYKCSFDYNNHQYINISLTDPVYRDITQDGLNLTNALIVASLPCVPYNDDLYYKFVAKIIPIEEQVALYIENLNEDKIQNVDKRGPISSPFVNFNLVVQTQQTPGVVLFENYEQLKQNINNSICYYSEFEYSLDNYEIALKHHNELKCVKNVLEKTKREVIKSYNTPLEIVEKQLEELINLVKVPFKKVDTFIKQNQKNAKKYEIYIFSKNVAISNGLQEHMDNIFRSPAYFDLKWLNSSCSKTAWKSAVLAKIKKVAKDIGQILSMENENIASILAQYYQTLSMEKVEEFLNSLKVASNITEKVTSNNYLHTNIDTSQISINTMTEKDVQTTLNAEHLLNPSNKDQTDNLQDSYVLNCVANSINPYTGEIITGIDNDLRTKLIEIAQMLDALLINKPDKRNRNKQGEGNLMSGERWTEDEELMLIEEFKQGLSIQQISEIHKRKAGGIKARLKKLKLID